VSAVLLLLLLLLLCVAQDMPGWGDDINLVRYLKVVLSYILEQRAKVGELRETRRCIHAQCVINNWHQGDMSASTGDVIVVCRCVTGPQPLC